MNLKLLSLAGSLEAGAATLALLDDLTTGELVSVYALHASASLLIAAVVVATLPRGMRRPRHGMIGLFALLNFFVPLLPLLMRASVFLGMRFRKLHEEAPVARVGEPEYSIHRANDRMKSRGGRLRAKLTNVATSTPERLTALLAIQEAPARVSADLLRQMLADPVEDIRLLAYAMIDGKEKSIGVRILKEEGRLELAEDDDTRYGCNKRLAELHWELVYQRLVQGDMMRHAAEQARHHGQAATQIRDDDAGLWFLLARVELDLGRIEEAQRALERAGRLGFPRDQTVPYEAEIEFLQRRYDRIPALFATMRTPPTALRLAAIHRFWTAS